MSVAASGLSVVASPALAGVARLVAALALLVGLSVAATLLTGYNSDALYLYSQAKDLIAFGSLRGWTFSAIPFTVPDLIAALPITAAVPGPRAYYFVAAPVQIVVLVAALSAWLARTQHRTFDGAMLVSAIAAVLVVLLYGLVFYPYGYFVVQAMFILNYHGLAAVCATLLAVVACDDDFRLLRDHLAATLVAVALLTASDFFFAVYFGAMLAAALLLSRSRAVAGLGVAVGGLSAAVFAVSYLLNPSLEVHIKASAATPAALGPWQVALRIVGLMLVPTVLVLVLRLRGALSRRSLILYVSLAMIAGALAAAGLIKDLYAFRYLAILVPVSVVLAVEVIGAGPPRREAALLAAAAASVGAVLLLVGTKPSSAQRPYRDEIACIDAAGQPGSTIVAEYWPAKIIFESTGRRHNLVQVGATLQAWDWISNERWRSLHTGSRTTFVVTDHIDAQTLARLAHEARAETICGGKLLKLDRPPPELDDLKWAAPKAAS
ncbi:hypothetical protein [Rhodopseudomonas telluris]|uniref:Glycosyltransferase RgtA/B/C/D-like domain-containing protein n=1 Tax=Rhodopseudomonas telluris TaxID=644215 RepID=A0ABV6EPK2_9BRAD